MSVYDSIMQGLNEAVDYANGKNTQVQIHKIEVAPVPRFAAADIKRIRAELGMTQVVFASVMGVSCKTVEAWEEGVNTPNGPSSRLLGLFHEDPANAKRLVMGL